LQSKSFTEAHQRVLYLHIRFNKVTYLRYGPRCRSQLYPSVLRGGCEDYIDYDIYTTNALGYFLRSGITHFGSYTCDYETNHDMGGEGGVFASGRITVWIDDDGEIEVSGSAENDDNSWSGRNWEWFREFRKEIRQWIESDNLGLISWDLMQHIDRELEGEVEWLRSIARGDEDENEEENEQVSESGITEDEDEAEDDDSSSLVAEKSENEEDNSCLTSVDGEIEEK
jgi:hypothetical protein